MPTGQGHAAIGFSGSRGDEYIGAYVAGRLSSDPPGTMGSIQQIKQGEGPYKLLDSQNRNRWGDYSSTSLDPRDDMTLWTLQTYAAPLGTQFNGVVSRWKTRVAQIKAPAPTLRPFSIRIRVGDLESTGHHLFGSGFYDRGDGAFSRIEVTGGAGEGDVTVLHFSTRPDVISVGFWASPGASPGSRNVKVTNPDGQSVTLAGAMTLLPSIHFGAAAYPAVEPGTGSSTVTITVDRGTEHGDEDVYYSTVGGSADGSDYTPAADVLKFRSGATQLTFDVTVLSDRLLENTEDFKLYLTMDPSVFNQHLHETWVQISDNRAATAPGNLTATAIGSGRIDLAWTDRCDNETGFEIERRTGVGSFALLTTFGAGVTSYFDVGVTGSTQYTYRVRAKKNALASSFSSEAAATTPSHPTAVQFQKAEFPGPEGGSLQVTVTRLGIVSGPSAVNVELTPGAATAGTDYTGSGSTVIFMAEETSKTLSFPLLADNLIEGDETVSLSLTSPQGAGLGARTTALMRITDDRAATAPANLQAQMDGALRMRLSWTDRSANATRFSVQAAQGQGEFAEVAKVQETAFSMDAQPGIPYRVRVVAERGSADASDPSPEVTFDVSYIGRARITPTSLAFGTVKVGKSKTLKLTIQNTARGLGEDLWVTVGTLPAPYSVVSGGGGFSIAPKKKRVVKVRYSPTSAGDVPPLSLRILTSDLPSRVVDIPITARGR